MIIGVPALSDAQCGFTAVAAAALPALDLDARWPGYGYPNDLLGAVARAGLRLREVTVRPVYRGEASGLGARQLGTFARVFLRWRGSAPSTAAAAAARDAAAPRAVNRAANRGQSGG